MQRKYGALPDRADSRDHIAISAPPGRQFQSIDLRAWMPPIRDQGQEGSCTAFAGTRLLSWLFNRFKKQELIFSPQFLYRAERIIEGDTEQDNGAQSRTMMAVMCDTGVCLESSLPYSDSGWKIPTTHTQLAEAQQYRIGAFHRIPDLDTLRSVLNSGYPASLAITVYESFESAAVAQNGRVPIPHPNEALLGYHEVCVAGMDEHSRCLLVANSWGPSWGDGGYFWLPYDYWERGVSDSWLAHLGPAWKPQSGDQKNKFWPFTNNDLKQVLKVIQANHKELMSTITDLQTAIDSLQGAVTTLATDVNNSIAALKAQIAAGSPVTQADLDAVTAKVQSILSAVQAEDATVNPPTPPGA